MEIEIRTERKKEIEFVLHGEDHTFCRLLINQLLKNPDVDIAQYDIPHPLVGDPVFYVKTKKMKPRAALQKAARELRLSIKRLTQ